VRELKAGELYYYNNHARTYFLCLECFTNRNNWVTVDAYVIYSEGDDDNPSFSRFKKFDTFAVFSGACYPIADGFEWLESWRINPMSDTSPKASLLWQVFNA
jgi:hypothetical protein